MGSQPTGGIEMTIEDVKQIIKNHKAHYPTNIFPEPEEGCSMDRYTAAGCRLVCDNILHTIDEQLKEEAEG